MSRLHNIIPASAIGNSMSVTDHALMRVALVHDYLTQFGGAEQVLVSLQSLYPQAATLTTLYDQHAELPGIDQIRIIESSLGKIGGLRTRHRLALPFYPIAMRELGRRAREFDTIVADSSAWAHQIGVTDNQAVVVYCHSPARFLYGDSDYLEATGMTNWMRRGWDSIWSGYRWLDRKAFLRADVVLANSKLVSERLRASVGIEASVLHPPIKVAEYRPAVASAAEDWFLVLSRLVPHKKLDLVVETCSRNAIRLKIIGAGRDESRLRSRAGPSVEFLGFQTQDQVVDHLQRCRALILPGVEDFGMTSVEAQAAGRPVIAINRGGAKETVLDRETGVLFDEQTEESLLLAMKRLDSLGIDSTACINQALKFDEPVFHQGILAAVDTARRKRGLS